MAASRATWLARDRAGASEPVESAQKRISTISEIFGVYDVGQESKTTRAVRDNRAPNSASIAPYETRLPAHKRSKTPARLPITSIIGSTKTDLIVLSILRDSRLVDLMECALSLILDIISARL